MNDTEALEAAAATGAPRASIRAVCDPNGRRWRVEGPGWTMKPEGMLNAAEAEVICRTAAHALSLNAALVAGGGSDPGPSIIPVAGTDGIGVLMRAANRVLDGMAEAEVVTIYKTQNAGKSTDLLRPFEQAKLNLNIAQADLARTQLDAIFPGNEMRFTPTRPQAPGRDLEDDGA